MPINQDEITWDDDGSNLDFSDMPARRRRGINPDDVVWDEPSPTETGFGVGPMPQVQEEELPPEWYAAKRRKTLRDVTGVLTEAVKPLVEVPVYGGMGLVSAPFQAAAALGRVLQPKPDPMEGNTLGIGGPTIAQQAQQASEKVGKFFTPKLPWEMGEPTKDILETAGAGLEAATYPLRKVGGAAGEIIGGDTGRYLGEMVGEWATYLGLPPLLRRQAHKFVDRGLIKELTGLIHENNKVELTPEESAGMAADVIAKANALKREQTGKPYTPTERWFEDKTPAPGEIREATLHEGGTPRDMNLGEKWQTTRNIRRLREELAGRPEPFVPEGLIEGPQARLAEPIDPTMTRGEYPGRMPGPAAPYSPDLAAEIYPGAGPRRLGLEPNPELTAGPESGRVVGKPYNTLDAEIARSQRTLGLPPTITAGEQPGTMVNWNRPISVRDAWAMAHAPVNPVNVLPGQMLPPSGQDLAAGFTSSGGFTLEGVPAAPSVPQLGPGEVSWEEAPWSAKEGEAPQVRPAGKPPRPFEDKTGVDLYDSMLQKPDYFKKTKGVTYKLQAMTPDEYIDATAQMQRIPDRQARDMVAAKKVESIVGRTSAGSPMPMLVLDRAAGFQDGRHRAMAAKKMGLEKVPVMVVDRVPEAAPAVGREYAGSTPAEVKLSKEKLITTKAGAVGPLFDKKTKVVRSEIGTDLPEIIIKHKEIKGLSHIRDAMTTYQGNKKTLAPYTAAIIEKGLPITRHRITVIDDRFGGSGGYSTALALSGKLPNLKTIRINELNPDRVRFIESVQNIEGFVDRILASRFLDQGKMEQVLIDLYNKMVSLEGRTSASAFGSRVKKLLETDGIKPDQRPLIQHIDDYGEASYATKGGEHILKIIKYNAEKAYKKAARVRSLGVNYVYNTWSAFDLPFEKGDHVLALLDPPYYGTAGYDKEKMVGIDFYSRLPGLFAGHRAAGNSVIYNDKAWWLGEKLPKDRDQVVSGRDAQAILREIQNNLDSFFILGRDVGKHGKETFGIIDGGRNARHEKPGDIYAGGHGQGAVERGGGAGPAVEGHQGSFPRPPGEAGAIPRPDTDIKFAVRIKKEPAPEKLKSLPNLSAPPGEFRKSFPLAKNTVDGRIVRKGVPNTDSISSSLDNYTVLPGIREVPMSEFELTGKSYSVSENKWIAELAKKIKESGEISSLIVVVDKEGPYILEGSHRADALYRIGAKSFPAMVVIDKGSIKKGGQPMFQVGPLYHGTWTKFDKFSTEYVTKGEGATAFGWGLYFTESKGIAKHYAKVIYEKYKWNFEHIRVKGLKIPPNEFEGIFHAHEIRSNIAGLLGIAELIKKASLPKEQKTWSDTILDPKIYSPEEWEKAKKSRYPADYAFAESLPTKNIMEVNHRNIRDLIKSYRKGEHSPGSVYATETQPLIDFYENVLLKAGINDIEFGAEPAKIVYTTVLHKGTDPKNYDFMEWYEPITPAQEKKINRALKKIQADDKNFPRIILKDKLFEEFGEITNISGERAYKLLTRYFENQFKLTNVQAQKAASEALLAAGINGIKYPAVSLGGSQRGVIPGTSNYVVFDDRVVAIEDVEKFSMKPQPSADRIFGEWDAVLGEKDKVQGYHGRNPLQALAGASGSEGFGRYIAKTTALAEFFGDVEKVKFDQPKKPLLVKDEPLHILQETDEIMEPIKPGDSEWTVINKMAVEEAGITDQNWGERMFELQSALTRQLLRRGYDSVVIRSAGDEWVVILDQAYLPEGGKYADKNLHQGGDAHVGGLQAAAREAEIRSQVEAGSLRGQGISEYHEIGPDQARIKEFCAEHGADTCFYTANPGTVASDIQGFYNKGRIFINQEYFWMAPETYLHELVHHMKKRSWQAFQRFTDIVFNALKDYHYFEEFAEGINRVYEDGGMRKLTGTEMLEEFVAHSTSGEFDRYFKNPARLKTRLVDELAFLREGGQPKTQRPVFKKGQGQAPVPTFEAKLFRGVLRPDSPIRDRIAGDRIPAQYAVGEHWAVDPTVAATYGEDVIDKTVTLMNPYTWKLPNKKPYYEEMEAEFGTSNPSDVTKQLLAKGHDGLVVQDVPVNRRGIGGAPAIAKRTIEVIVFKEAEKFAVRIPDRGLTEAHDRLLEARKEYGKMLLKRRVLRNKIAKLEKHAAELTQANAKKVNAELLRRSKLSLASIEKKVAAQGVKVRGLDQAMTQAQGTLPAEDRTIVKRRDIGTADAPRYAPAVTQAMFDKVKSFKEPGIKPLAGWTINPIRSIAALGEGAKDLFYYPVRTAYSKVANEQATVFKDLDAIRKKLPWKSGDRIGIFAISKQPKGLDLLKEAGITTVPTLSQPEMAAYDWMRGKLKELYTRLNDARREIGMMPFREVQDYFTFFHRFSVWNELGLKPQFKAESNLADFPIHLRSTLFKNIKARTQAIYPVEYNAWDIFRQYTSGALLHINVTKTVALGRELLGTIPATPNRPAYLLRDEKPRAAAMLTEYLDFIAGQKIGIKVPELIERPLKALQKNLVGATLSGNLRSFMIQPLATVNAVAMIGPQRLIQGALELASSGSRHMALEKSETLRGRIMDVSYADATRGVLGVIGKVKGYTFQAGLWPLKFLDYLTAEATFIGSYRLAKSKGMAEDMAIRFADDIVVKSQGSGSRTDLSPIQRTTLGKVATVFGTFQINQWGQLYSDIFGMGPGAEALKKSERLKRILYFLGGIALANTIMEDVLGVQSPFPTPFNAYMRARDQGKSHAAATYEATLELFTMLPFLGGMRYGSTPLGAVAEWVGDVFKKMSPSKGFKRPTAELIMKGVGVPGTSEYWKTKRGLKQGKSLPESLLGTTKSTSPENPRLIGIRGHKRRSRKYRAIQ
jgi:hypothetical protein